MIDALLYRQIHPTWIFDNRVTSQAFSPTPKDRKRLSVYDGQKISAEAAWRHYSGKHGLKSVGVMAVTETECAAKNLPIIPDPKPSNEAHTLIYFDGLSSRAIKKTAAYLAVAANKRSWSYRPD